MPGQESNAKEEADLLSYLALQDTIRWQGPALALAAQAFLLTIATAEHGTAFTRAVSASLGLFTALAAINLLAWKTRQVLSIKDELKTKGFSDEVLHPPIAPAALWLLALGLFALADITILTMAIFGSPWTSVALPEPKTKKFGPSGYIFFAVSVLGLIAFLDTIHWSRKKPTT
jgi:hypothetical protein